jgi:hypothetical protein
MLFISLYCAAALGTIRLYGLYLEHRISETAGKIGMQEINLEMSKKYSELLSPEGYTVMHAKSSAW